MKLKNLRRSLGFTQKQVAEKSGLSLHKVSRLENGKDPQVQRLLDAARDLELDGVELRITFPDGRTVTVDLAN